MKITASDILSLLETRHSQDVFVGECKNGPSWTRAGNPLLRLDAWAMRRSYSKPCVWGYEIKVSRADFVQDDKWHLYLPYCNEFYFVTPPKLIDPDELPHEAGLLWTSKNCSRLYTKKKSPHRRDEIDAALYKYILMSRAKIVDAYDVDKSSGRDYWRRWLEQREEDREIGSRVSVALSERYHRDVTKVQLKQVRLEERLGRLERVAAFVRANQIDMASYDLEAAIRRQIDRARKLTPKDFVWRLEELHRQAGAMLKQIDDCNAKSEESDKAWPRNEQRDASVTGGS
jgi:hypothetical protein